MTQFLIDLIATVALLGFVSWALKGVWHTRNGRDFDE